MKVRMLVIVSCVLVLGAFGCTTMGTPAVNTTNVQNVDFSQSFKKGSDCSTVVLFVFGPFGDSSVVNAAKNAGIKKVEVVDYRSSWFPSVALPIVYTHCVVVHGN